MAHALSVFVEPRSGQDWESFVLLVLNPKP